MNGPGSEEGEGLRACAASRSPETCCHAQLRPVSPTGSYLGHVPDLRKAFLNELFDLLDDDQPRYFVAEARADADSVAIVKALVARGSLFAPTGSLP